MKVSPRRVLGVARSFTTLALSSAALCLAVAACRKAQPLATQSASAPVEAGKPSSEATSEKSADVGDDPAPAKVTSESLRASLEGGWDGRLIEDERDFALVLLPDGKYVWMSCDWKTDNGKSDWHFERGRWKIVMKQLWLQADQAERFGFDGVRERLEPQRGMSFGAKVTDAQLELVRHGRPFAQFTRTDGQLLLEELDRKRAPFHPEEHRAAAPDEPSDF